MRKSIPVVGEKFGRLTNLSEQTFRFPPLPSRKWGDFGVVCECECGNKDVYRVNDLKSGHTQSCGCLQVEVSAANMNSYVEASRWKHGLWGHPHYDRWYGMMNRCYSESNTRYKDYGGRGIRVHEPWHDPAVFIEYLESELGPLPDGYSLDRIDNDGNYEPGNIRWADYSTQNKNRRSWV